MDDIATDKSVVSALIVEDSDSKFMNIKRVIDDYVGRDLLKELHLERAATLTAAERKLLEKDWSFIILDISLDIALSSSGPRKGGHATLGGMDIAQKMFLLGLDYRTIIVTAFDAFQSGSMSDNPSTILGLEDVERKAQLVLGDAFVGCVRYGDSGWHQKLKSYLSMVL